MAMDFLNQLGGPTGIGTVNTQDDLLKKLGLMGYGQTVDNAVAQSKPAGGAAGGNALDTLMQVAGGVAPVAQAAIGGTAGINALIAAGVMESRIPALLKAYENAQLTQEKHAGQLGRMERAGLAPQYETRKRRIADEALAIAANNAERVGGIGSMGRLQAMQSASAQRAALLGDIEAERAMASNVFGKQRMAAETRAADAALALQAARAQMEQNVAELRLKGAMGLLTGGMAGAQLSDTGKAIAAMNDKSSSGSNYTGTTPVASEGSLLNTKATTTPTDQQIWNNIAQNTPILNGSIGMQATPYGNPQIPGIAVPAPAAAPAAAPVVAPQAGPLDAMQTTMPNVGNLSDEERSDLIRRMKMDYMDMGINNYKEGGKTPTATTKEAYKGGKTVSTTQPINGSVKGRMPVKLHGDELVIPKGITGKMEKLAMSHAAAKQPSERMKILCQLGEMSLSEIQRANAKPVIA